MIRPRRIAVASLAVLAVAAIDACRKKPTPAPAPVTTSTGRDTAAERMARDEAARRAREDSLQRERDAAARRAADSADAARRADLSAGATLRSTLTAVIHYDYDQSDLRDDARAALDAKVPILRANPGVSIRIGGHTDERGSDEYNLALGQRRAASAKRYLVEHGVAENRIETISYGEERPVAQGSDESAWAQNRRAEFEITAGGGTLRRP